LEGDALGPPPPVDLEAEKRNADFVRMLIEQGLVNAVHDVSDGGIACAATEMAMASGVGVVLYWEMMYGGSYHTPANDKPFEFTEILPCLFGEDNGRILVSVPQTVIEDNFGEFANLVVDLDTRVDAVGGFISDRNFEVVEATNTHSTPLSRLREAHEGWLPTYMNAVDETG
ncbi:MAG: AIR synthase-related protein, partial [Pseudomonadota bacterium]